MLASCQPDELSSEKLFHWTVFKFGLFFLLISMNFLIICIDINRLDNLTKLTHRPKIIKLLQKCPQRQKQKIQCSFMPIFKKSLIFFN